MVFFWSGDIDLIREVLSLAKVILLSGSPRAKGNTMQVLSECAGVIEAEGLEAEVISLHGKNIRSCIACYKCKELGRC
ncbi:MAG TPA: flavodoxin family protein, partial [Clostridia bacterium]|nr:flavodoxin family protein [Clostridia bacterium]